MNTRSTNTDFEIFLSEIEEKLAEAEVDVVAGKVLSAFEVLEELRTKYGV